jgi:hypothetical protein
MMLDLALLAWVAAAAPEKVIPAINAIDAWQQVGQQPYELTWTQREQDPHTLVDFEDLTGWTLELHGGARGELRRSREQQMWGQSVAKFVFSGTGKQSRVVARPPQPIAIPERFDSIEMWGYGYIWGWTRDAANPPVDVAILVADASGKEHRIPITDVRWKQWWLIHRKAPAATLQQIAWPARFAGIEISSIDNPEQRYFYCDSLTFFTETFGELSLRPQPKRNLQPFRGQNVGMNTGAGALPFPTREETILPLNREKDFRVSARRTAPGRFEWQYQGRDAKVVYEYRPAKGGLGELTASVNGGAPFRPLDGGGVRFGEKLLEGELVSAGISGDVVTARFRSGSHLVEYQLRLWQKSLVLDVLCEGGEATGLDFGQVSGVTKPRLITVPYLTYGETNPRVLLSGTSPLFTSVWFDWYRTNASEPFYTKEPAPTAINGGLRYIAKTDGHRNTLCERIFVTNSPVYEETLPVIANPPSLRRQEGGEVLWTVTAPATFEKDHERSKEIRSYGLDKIMQHSHEVTWRDEGDSFTMRIHAAPQKGGDAGLQRYIKAQNELGWLQGVYTNYTDLIPTNTNWSPDNVQRQPDGEWRRAWMRSYALKPAKAVELDDYYAGRIQQRYGTKMSYTDVHTAVSPWRYCDFDARVPGAGTLAATFYAYGQLLLNDQRVYGPTQSEATYQWMYAGLESGSYGWVYTGVNLLTHPLDVAFQLNAIHPLEADYGMGYTHYYLDKIDPKWKQSPKRRDYVDLFLATTIAYGNMGWLVTEFDDRPFHWEAMARSYYMMQQLQRQYAFVRPSAIEYAGPDAGMQSPSQAHASGAVAGGRIHVAYENGTHVYVNRGTAGTWRIADTELPVSGWLAYNAAAGFREISAIVGGHRVDYVQAPAYEFLDGRGQWTEMGGLAATGGVARRLRPAEGIELIDIYGNDRIAFRAGAGGTLTAYDPGAKSLGPVELTSPRAGWREFKPVANGRMYVFTPAAQ